MNSGSRRFAEWTVLLATASLCRADLVPPEPSREEIRQRLTETLTSLGISPAEAEIDAHWDSQTPILDAVARSLVVVPETPILYAQAMEDPTGSLDLQRLPENDFVRANVSLYAARELVRRNLIEEGLAAIAGLDEQFLVDRATFWFLKAVCEHRLHRREDAIASLDRLAALSSVPERYRVMAESMRASLEPLERESLDGIAHDMRDVRRRLSIGRSDEPTQELEQDILDRLDKLIEQLEQQRDASSSSAGSGGSNSSGPADDSRILGGKGEGKVDPKRFRDRGSWGNLPEKDRDQALQSIGRDFPPHYREAVEKYFRRQAEKRPNP